MELTSRASRGRCRRTLELSAYRVVQEALTNTLKHSGGATRHGRVRYGADGARRRSTSTMVTAGAGQSAGTGGGHGLIGMRERVGLHGGPSVPAPPRGGSRSSPTSRSTASSA